MRLFQVLHHQLPGAAQGGRHVLLALQNILLPCKPLLLL